MMFGFGFRDSPPQTEICKSRGNALASIITNKLEKTSNDGDTDRGTQIIMASSPGAYQGKDSESPRDYFQEVSRWSSDSSDYSEPETEPEFDDQEPYEESLQRYRDFFANRPLMRCMDDDAEDKLLADLLFDRLLKEVQQPSLPSKKFQERSRGELHVRAFWDNVRMQLQVDDEVSPEHEWPVGYPEPAED